MALLRSERRSLQIKTQWRKTRPVTLSGAKGLHDRNIVIRGSFATLARFFATLRMTDSHQGGFCGTARKHTHNECKEAEYGCY